jgi:mannose-6-phosphate isomerase-like protein (cupin superfamily)
MAMRKRWMWALVLAVAAVAAAVAAYAGTVHATPSQGFSSKQLAKGTFGEIFSHVQTQDPQFWNEVVQTRGDSDLFVLENTWEPGGSTGWHTHPGPTFVIVTEGSVTVYDGDDPTCTPHMYSADGTNAVIDVGGGHVHIIRNETNKEAKAIAVRLIPKGAVGTHPEPDPGNCSF